LQKYKVVKGTKYLWTNRKVATGQVLQAGTVEPDERGLLTVPAFCVDRDPAGNKLVIESALGQSPPAVDAAAKVGDLSLAEYLQQCRRPVLFPQVKPVPTVFSIADFTAARYVNPDGTFSYKGGSFSTHLDTIVEILQPGPYVISARAKGEFGAAWPLLTLHVGGVYGERMETKTIDGTDWRQYHWYAVLAAGKLPIRLTVHGDYYATPVLPALGDKRLHVASLGFLRADAGAKGKPFEVRVSPRRVTLPAGMPVNCTAMVLDALGERLDVPVRWTCSAQGKIDAHGVFQATAPGEYLVTATAGDVAGTAPVQVGDRLAEDFNCGGNVLRGWSTWDFADEPGCWYPPAAGHTYLNSLWQHNRGATSLLAWDHGRGWTDYGLQADVFLAPRERGQPLRLADRRAVYGLAIRAADRDNHYRLEVHRRDDGSQARLVRRVAGAEAVLAQTDSPPPLAPFDWQTNPMCPGWHKLSPIHAEERGLNHWRMDRLRLAAKGDTLRAWVNGKELFPGGIRDSALRRGTAGLYAENVTVMDNVEVRREK